MKTQSFKALKSPAQNGRPHGKRNRTNRARHRAGLVLALIGLLSATGLVTGPISLTSAQADTPSWSYTGSLNTARYGHTATRLSDGKVLVVGGKSVELYDPEIPDPAPRIIQASVSGKWLLITGENFHAGAVILLNGEAQVTKNDGQNPQTRLIGKRAGKKVKPGDKLQVNNPDGSLSDEFTFPGSPGS